MVVVVRCVIMLGMIVIVPLGLGLIRATGTAFLRQWWLVVAVPAAVSLWLPRGPVSVALAAGYAVATVALVGAAVDRWARLRSLAPQELATLTALVMPAVAGVALIAERAGVHLFGFDLDVLLLTVAHFHMAGFAAALVAALTCRAVGDSRAGRSAAVTVPVGTVVVLAGFFIGEWVELAGAVILTAGMWVVAWLTWDQVRSQARDRVTRLLLSTSAVALVGTMLLALSWALGEAVGLPHPSLTWMAATHGVANAVAFAACGLVAWWRVTLLAGVSALP